MAQIQDIFCWEKLKNNTHKNLNFGKIQKLIQLTGSQMMFTIEIHIPYLDYWLKWSFNMMCNVGETVTILSWWKLLQPTRKNVWAGYTFDSG